MFFLIGISSTEKKLEFIQTMLCSHCEQFGRLEIFMNYSYLSLFFIPIFKWNKKFYVKSSCCNTIYSVDNSIGNEILKGHPLTLSEQDLHIMNSNKHSSKQNHCSNCGYITETDFIFCPKCGNRL